MQAICDVKNIYGKTALHVASENGNLDAVKLFVSLGASIDILDNDGKTAFDRGKSHIEVASYLGRAMSKKFQEEEKYEDALKIYDELFEIQVKALGCDHPETTKTHDYIGSLRTLLYLIGVSDTKPPSFMKDLEAQNAAGKTPLHIAAEKGELIIVKRFVSLGVDINILDNDGKTAFDLGKKHVEVASYLGHILSEKFQEDEKYEDALKIYEELLEIQVETLGSDHSETTNTRECISSLNSLLFFLGLSTRKPPSFIKDLEAQNAAGKTPLHIAAEKGELIVVKRFVSLGVNTNILDNDGKTAFDLGKSHIQVATYLGHTMSEKFQEEEKYEDALKIYEELLEIQKEKFGCDHPETNKTYNYVKCLQTIIGELGVTKNGQPAQDTFVEPSPN